MGSIIGEKKQQRDRIKRTQELCNQGKQEVGKLNKREKFIAGIALYVAEGTKKDRRCEFANSDPRLIKFMIEWFQYFCLVPIKKIRGAIWIHEGLDELRAREFWSKLTEIPLNNFHKTYIVKNKLKSKKIRKNLHEFGVFSIRFSDAAIHRKIMGWIAGLLQ